MASDHMRCITFQTPSGPEVLELAQRPIPMPGAGEILVKVAAAGVNGPDMMQRKGLYPPPPGASDVLGLEISGEVVALGPDVRDWSVGDQLCALTKGGGYAEYVTINADHCLPIPDGVSLIDTAGLCETFFTVWSNVFFGQDIPRGANFLVHGGAGGIGSTAVQLGAAFGLNVLTTVSSPDKAAFVASLGASHAIDYTCEDFVSVTKDAGGADIILDVVGGSYVARNFKAAKPDARLISLAFRQGSKVEIDLMPIMLKRLVLTGSTLRPRSDAFKAAVAQDLLAQVWPLFASGQLRSTTHATFPLDEAANAHDMMESSRHIGKILLTM